MLGKVLQLDIRDLIEQRDFATIKEAMSDLEPADIAELMQDLEEREEALVFRLLPRGRAAKVFEHLPFEDQEGLLQRLSSEAVKHILNEMSPDDRTSLLEEFPAEVTHRLLRMLSPEERRIASTLLGYPEESVGRLMTPEFMAIREEWTAHETLEFLRQKGEDRETLNVLYVVDSQGILQDEISLRQLVLAKPEQKISDLMDRQVVGLRVTDDREKAVEEIMKYDRPAMPVVDSTGRLVGIVTFDDVLDVAEEEATEDIQLMAAVQTLEESYLETPYVTMFRKRVAWLVILFITQTITVNALAHFEDTTKELFTQLSIFLALIISTGGNTGSQASSLMIRGLAVRDVELKDYGRVFAREILMGLSLGVVLGTLGAVRAILGALDWYVPIVVGISLVGIVVFGTLTGSTLPFVFKKLGFDPAVSSGPFVTTFVDIMGIVIYFTTGVLVLRLVAGQ